MSARAKRPETETSVPRIDALQADRLGGAPLDRVAAADLRVVTMDWVNGGATEHIVLAEACKRLHFDPGVNPYNGCQAARMWRLRVAELRPHGPYWWAKPNLGVAPSVGVFTITAGIGRTIWLDENHEVLA